MTTRTCPTCGAPDYGTPFCVSCQNPFPRHQEETVFDVESSLAPEPVDQPAGFFRRFFALLIDWLFLSIIGDIVFMSYQLGFGKKGSAMNIDVVMGLSTILAILYFTLLIGDGGQTFGKKIFRIRVIQTNGMSVSYGKALARSLGYILSFFLGTLLGFLWALWDRKNQTWHDKIAGTIVVKI
jgi:uncharacterized RDD family membrane protein YckC